MPSNEEAAGAGANRAEPPRLKSTITQSKIYEPADGASGNQVGLAAWRLFGFRRRAEVIRLALSRRQRDLIVDARTFLFVGAVTLGTAPAGPVMIRNRWVTWPGINRDSLIDFGRRADLGRLSDDEIENAFQRQERWAELGERTMSAEAMGRTLVLSLEERDNLDIRTIAAFDDNEDQRLDRRKAAARDRDELRRRELGAVPRAEWLAMSVAAEARSLGVSRQTVYRRRRQLSQTM